MQYNNIKKTIPQHTYLVYVIRAQNTSKRLHSLFYHSGKDNDSGILGCAAIPEDGNNKFQRTVENHLQDYMASQPEDCNPHFADIIMWPESTTGSQAQIIARKACTAVT